MSNIPEWEYRSRIAKVQGELLDLALDSNRLSHVSQHRRSIGLRREIVKQQARQLTRAYKAGNLSREVVCRIDQQRTRAEQNRGFTN